MFCLAISVSVILFLVAKDVLKKSTKIDHLFKHYRRHENSSNFVSATNFTCATEMSSMFFIKYEIFRLSLQISVSKLNGIIS